MKCPHCDEDLEIIEDPQMYLIWTQHDDKTWTYEKEYGIETIFSCRNCSTEINKLAIKTLFTEGGN